MRGDQTTEKQLHGVTRPMGVGAVRGDQVGRGQLGETRLLGKVVRGDQASEGGRWGVDQAGRGG